MIVFIAYSLTVGQKEMFLPDSNK